MASPSHRTSEPVEDRDQTMVGSLPLNDSQELLFYTYTFGGKRLGAARVFIDSEKYAGPSKSGLDMTLDELTPLVALLPHLSAQVESGDIVPPHEAARIPAGRSVEWVVRIAEDEANPEVYLLDIRKYVTSKRYTGWTRKGLRIAIDYVDGMLPNLERLCETLTAWEEGRTSPVSGPAEVVEERGAARELSTTSVPDKYKDFF